MPKEFEAATRAVVREVDPQGDWIAVRSLTDADRFHCLYLVKKKKRFFGHQYDKADLSLLDILEVQEGDELFDKLVSGLQGQYQMAERHCQLLPNPTLNSPLRSTKSTSQQRNGGGVPVVVQQLMNPSRSMRRWV